jgi:amino acid permease
VQISITIFTNNHSGVFTKIAIENREMHGKKMAWVLVFCLLIGMFANPLLASCLGQQIDCQEIKGTFCFEDATGKVTGKILPAASSTATWLPSSLHTISPKTILPTLGFFFVCSVLLPISWKSRTAATVH